MDKYGRFEAWLRENGAKFDQLELREYPSDTSSSQNEEIGEEKKETTSTPECIDMDSEMRGVHASSHIPPNTLCMLIPRRCLITVEMGQATPIGQAIMSADLDLDAPKHIFLMVYVLWDRKVNGANSFFHPYYEILPKTLRNLPIFWKDSELDHLKGSYLLQQIADRNAAIEDDYHSICEIAPLDKLCSLDEFKWARMCVCSRNFGLQIDGHRTSALVPHADMLNHYRPRETKWTFDEERQAFTITTLQCVHAGAEVYDSYGQKCNHRFLLNYGFAVEDNCELDGYCPNEVPVELFVSDTDALYPEKLEFWTRGESSFSSVDNISCESRQTGTSLQAPPLSYLKRIRLCVANNENTRLFFSLLRTLACNEEELRVLSSTMPHMESTQGFDFPYATDRSNYLRSVGGDHGQLQVQDYPLRPQQQFHHNIYRAPIQNQHTSHLPHLVYIGGTQGTVSGPNITYPRSCRDIRHPISLRNEREAMRLLRQIVNRHLNAYPTSLQQDCADLQDYESYPLFSNQRHAKIQVKGEKEVLHHYAVWARTALDVLDVLEDELNTERGTGGNIEVRLLSGHRMSVDSNSYTAAINRPSFDYVTRHMEDEECVHHTIVRYCADVLGSLRREEFKALRRQQRALIHYRSQQNQNGTAYHSSNNATNIRNSYA